MKSGRPLSAVCVRCRYFQNPSSKKYSTSERLGSVITAAGPAAVHEAPHTTYGRHTASGGDEHPCSSLAPAQAKVQ
eukprot:scaffold51_cov401-Prasinococcus_capsulatus_cf.AAC.8